MQWFLKSVDCVSSSDGRNTTNNTCIKLCSQFRRFTYYAAMHLETTVHPKYLPTHRLSTTTFLQSLPATLYYKTSTLGYNVDEDLSSITNCVLFRLLILWSFSTSSFCKFSTSWETTCSTNTSPKTILYQDSWNPNLSWIDPTILMVDWDLHWFTC